MNLQDKTHSLNRITVRFLSQMEQLDRVGQGEFVLDGSDVNAAVHVYAQELMDNGLLSPKDGGLSA